VHGLRRLHCCVSRRRVEFAIRQSGGRVSDTAHIASLIVRARCDSAQSTAERLMKLSGVEVHAVQDGKIIVVLEAASESALANLMEQIRAEPDVVLVNLIYHEVETT
jgi:periplasmic nitrate reductase NapD